MFTPMVDRVYQANVPQADGTYPLQTVVQWHLDTSGPYYLYLDPASATATAIKTLVGQAVDRYAPILSLAQLSDPMGLNVHDVRISQVPAAGAGPGVTLQTRVEYFVGTHGPFTLTFTPPADDAATVAAAVQRQVLELRNLFL